MTDENNQIKFFLYENWARTKTGQHTVSLHQNERIALTRGSRSKGQLLNRWREANSPYINSTHDKLMSNQRVSPGLSVKGF